MAVILQTAKCHHNKGTDSLGQGDTWESGIITVAKKEVCIPFLMQLDQLWLCLIGVLLSIHHFSTFDKEILLSRVLETFSQLSKLQGQGHWKIGSGESVTWLVSIVMSQQGFCHWDTFLCDKNYMYDYITTGVIIRHVQNALPILTKRNIDVNTLDEFAGIYKATLFWG